MRQLYFVVQSLLINPQEAGKVMGAFRKLHDALVQVTADEVVKDTLAKVGDLVESDRTFDALKLLRTLFEPVEAHQSALAESAAVQAA
jgi:flagellar protein FlbT